MLGFDVIGEERVDPRVQAPAVLLRLDLAYAEAQIAPEKSTSGSRHGLSR